MKVPGAMKVPDVVKHPDVMKLPGREAIDYRNIHVYITTLHLISGWLLAGVDVAQPSGCPSTARVSLNRAGAPQRPGCRSTARAPLNCRVSLSCRESLDRRVPFNCPGVSQPHVPVMKKTFTIGRIMV